MELAIRQALKTPEVGIPIALLILVVAAHAAVWLRSVAEGATPIIPSLSVFAKDVAIVLLVVLMFVLSKVMVLFLPDSGTTVGGIDVAPLYAAIGPAVFFIPGLLLAAWLVKRKVEVLVTSANPPAA